MTRTLALTKLGNAKERPILFSGEMIRAILENRKTVTRRVVKPQPVHQAIQGTDGVWYDADCIHEGVELRCPYGVRGTKLWVREAFRFMRSDELPQIPRIGLCADCGIVWREGKHSESGPWKPSIHMPRWASRILLEVVSVRVERLQDISEADARREGIPDFDAEGNLINKGWVFEALWNSLNAKRGYSWESNPWVWVINFKRIKP